MTGDDLAGFADRFFARQRQEILARVEALHDRRKARVWGGLLAAASLALACMGAGLVLDGAKGSHRAVVREDRLGVEARLWPDEGSDPLAHFDLWLMNASGTESVDGINPLPPLELDQGVLNMVTDDFHGTRPAHESS